MKIKTSYPVIENGVNLTPNLYYDNASSVGEDYYDATGKRRKKSSGGRVRRGEGTFGTVSKNLFSKEAISQRQKNRAEKRRLEAGKGKKDTTKVIEKTPEVVKEEIKVTETTPVVVTPTPIIDAKPEGMSKGAKVGIVVGVLAILGVVGFMIYKKAKK